MTSVQPEPNIVALPATTKARGSSSSPKVKGSGVRRTGSRRLGRPVASDGDERRRRIIEVARREFARSGYVGTTNRRIAEQAGITTGAIYHYFTSKRDVYLAVFEETDRVILTRYQEVTSDASLSFAEMVAQLLEVSSQMNSEDETLAAFLASASVDAHRDPELLPTYLEHDHKMMGFFSQLIDAGVEEGVIHDESRADILDAIRVLTLGLTWYSVRLGDPVAHRRATAATIQAMRGNLFPSRPAGKRRATR
ncbi:MAG: TetR/AcrR family transcriptional regulator [Acidobacteriota bacterium]|nr:TetR/AcrR family transcriptional regulator [Acidobacteriota bacterium]